MRNLIPFLLFFGLLLPASYSNATDVRDDRQAPPTPPVARAPSYPKIVLYSTSWCPHCREAREYLTARNIPFMELDVETDEEALDTLITKYGTKRVPLIVIGDDDAVVEGFTPESFEKALHSRTP
ncbi:MAG TPA: glutaredoxin domain-containing protein [Geobacteraceae bacterium]|nr:glutaredoxin domain-containing protein [Geobacteraceae bacterium]